MRAFAVAALGYDPGEPYNVEHVRVKIMEGGDALVSYRNRVQELKVPAVDPLPTWTIEDSGPTRASMKGVDRVQVVSGRRLGAAVADDVVVRGR